MRKSTAAAVLLFLLLYIVPLGARPILAPDEFRYAEIPREMLASGEWVVPHLDGVRYFEKPVLGYWLIAASMSVFGDTPFATRLPSALAAGVCALLIFLLGRKFADERPAAALAAVVLLTFGQYFFISTVAILDTTFTMFVTASMASFFYAAMERDQKRKIILTAAFGVFCGLAFLIKGFLAFALPAIVIPPFLLWNGQRNQLLKIGLLSIAVAFLVSAPWSVGIHLREPDFWNRFFWNEHIKRFLSEHPQHAEPFWYFVPVLIMGALPWTALFPATNAGLWRTRFRSSLLKFSACWFLLPFLFFSASAGKLSTYILPCFPPLALLTAIGLVEYYESGRRKAFAVGAVILAGMICLIALALIAAQFIGVADFKLYGGGERWKVALGVAALAAWSLFLILSARQDGLGKKMLLFSAGPVLFLAATHVLIPGRLIETMSPGEFLERYADHVTPQAILVSDNNLMNAVCWSYKRADVYLLGNPGELRYGFGYSDSGSRWLSENDFRELIHNSQAGKVILFTRPKIYDKFSHSIPKPQFEETNGKYLIAEFYEVSSRE